MEKEDNSWKIPQPLPGWISQLEDKFGELIEEELRIRERAY